MKLNKAKLKSLDHILDEFIRASGRFALEKRPKLIPDSKWIFPPMINRGDGTSTLIGDDAQDKLIEFSREFRKEFSYERIISNEDVVSLVKSLMTDFIFKQDTRLSKIETFIEELDSKIQLGLKSYNVIVPFIASHKEEFSQVLKVGKATVYSRDSFLRNTSSKLRQNEMADDYRYNEIADHYEKFLWFIEVPVPAVYDSNLAVNIAQRIATLILNLFHLKISASHSDKMKVGFEFDSPQTSSYVILSEQGGEPFCIRSKGARGNVGFKEAFLDIFHVDSPSKLLEIISRSVDLSLQLRNSYPFNNRLVEAMHWYGEGVREKSITVAVVKYVTALERLLTFNEHGEIKRRICNRATVLLINSGFAHVSEADIVKKDIAKIYELRSKIVHGSISPTSSSLDVSIRDIESICRKTIYSFAVAIGHSLNSSDKESKLQSWLTGLVEKYYLQYA